LKERWGRNEYPVQREGEIIKGQIGVTRRRVGKKSGDQEKWRKKNKKEKGRLGYRGGENNRQ